MMIGRHAVAVWHVGSPNLFLVRVAGLPSCVNVHKMKKCSVPCPLDSILLLSRHSLLAGIDDQYI